MKHRPADTMPGPLETASGAKKQDDMNKDVLPTPATQLHQSLLILVGQLMDAKPDPGSVEDRMLQQLADVIEVYERAVLDADGVMADAPAGYKLVPIEPTPAMVNAAACVSHDDTPTGGGGHSFRQNMAVKEYAAMLAAAPDAVDGGQQG